MHVVWKRPDGFHGSSPDDFHVVEIGQQARIWLHRTDKENFPLRISGDWKEDESTRRLNLLVNMISRSNADWVQHLVKSFHNSMSDDANAFIDELGQWILKLQDHLKGDTWEVEIMGRTLTEVRRQLETSKPAFIKAVTAS